MNTAPMLNAADAPSGPLRAPRAAARRTEPESCAARGRVLENRYLIEELLDEGPLSQRYRAYDMATDEMVTVELLRGPAVHAWPRVRQAITRLAAHHHRHLAALLGHGVYARRWPFLVFEMPGAQTLGQLMRSTAAPLELRRALRIGVECANALAALHAAGVVHGRLSLEHVRLTGASPGAEGVKLDGFGLAASSAAPGLTSRASSDRSAAPSAAGIAGDIQRLGEVLRQIASSIQPKPRSAAAPARSSTAAASGPGDLPRRILDKIISRCLSEDPSRRYPNAALLGSDLRRLEMALEARCSKAPPTPPRETLRSGQKVTVTIVSPRARARVAAQPALPKVIVRSDLLP